MNSGSITAFIILMTLFLPVFSLAGDIVIVANENVPVSNLAIDDIRQIFLGRKTTWENGAKIIFVVQDGTDAGESFLKTYIMKNAYQYDIYWRKQVFTGRGKPPKSFSSDQELVQFVSQTPNAIGFMSAGTDIGKAKTIPIQ